MATRGYDIFTQHEATSRKMAELVKEHKSFKITQIDKGGDFVDIVNKIEEMLERAGYTCRVYTAYRRACMAVGFIPSPVTWGIGLAAALAIAAHNIVTYNPDYEISKDFAKAMITVSYQRGYDD